MIVLTILLMILMIFDFCMKTKKYKNEITDQQIALGTLTNTQKEEQKNDLALKDNTENLGFEITEKVDVAVSVNAFELKKLDSVNWEYSKFSKDESFELNNDQMKNPDKGYNIYLENNTIEKIEFTEDYKKPIVNNLLVSSERKEIIKSIGTPIMENEENEMIGYVTKKYYIYFYYNESRVVCYRKKVFSNVKLEENLYNYASGEFKGLDDKFIDFMAKTFLDFKVEVDEQGNTIFTSGARGISFIINDGIDITLYKNYEYPNRIMKSLKDHLEYIDEYYPTVQENG